MRALFLTATLGLGVATLCTGCQQQSVGHVAGADHDQQGAQEKKEEKAESEQSEQSEQSEHFTQLKRLSWLIGTWEDVDKEDDMVIETINDWEGQRNFIIQDFSVKKANNEEMSGQQIIGWDPQTKQIRSWIFDTDGGFAEGVWNQQGDNWVLDVISTLPDGRKGSATYFFSHIQPDRYTWEADDRQVGDVVLENVGPIEVMRKK